MENNRVLVPIDFTDITENALKFAIGAARAVNSGIALLHIIDKQELQPEAEDRLNAMIYKYNYAEVPMKSYTKVGKIYDGIGEAAEELGSGLIFMGTHGMKGMQFLLGSHAMRVVTNSKIPFIITQDRVPKNDSIDSIVMPVDLGSEEKQILTAVIRAAKTFKAKVHLFVSKRNDEFHENAVNRNVAFAKRYLDEHEVEHTTTRAISVDDYDAQLVRFADSIDADLIAIINHREDGIKNLFGASFDQNIITNKAKIPVLIMNTKDTTALNDIFGVFG
jgi:nucleotide-binding universal stress UspA family protein